MKPVIIFVITFVLLIPMSVSAGDELVPQWIKTNAGWWAGGQIDDTTFIDGLEYLISKDILNVDAVQTSKHSEGIPEWVKHTANWWSSNIVTDSEFLNSIKYLIENGIITIEKTPNDFYDIQNWQIYDHSRQSLGVYLEGYVGTITEGDFVYFAAFDSSQGRHGEILRYDTNRDFESLEAWSTFDAGANGVGNDPDSFTGIISDGQFLYFAPYHNGDEFSGEVLRYDTARDFESVEAWSTFDPSKNGIGNNPRGFGDGVFDGKFVYFSPFHNGETPHGEVLRYDTTKDFESVEAWGTFDPSKNGLGFPPKFSDTNKQGSDAVGYSGIVFDGNSIYFVPFIHASYDGVPFPHGNVLKFQAWK